MVAPDLDADAQAKVLRQVEFYFSDSNLPGDKFLLKSIEDSEDGLVSLPLVCSFSRMRSHLGLKEHGPENVSLEIMESVASVLQRSTSLRLSEDGTKVGRVAKLKSPNEVQAEVNARSIAASPLPWNITLDEVETFFKQYAKVNSIRLPRLVGVKAFSGFATIEFASEEEAQRVLGLKLVLQGAELELEPKNAYDAHQAAIAEQNGSKNGQVKQNGSAGRAGEEDDDDDDYPGGLVVLFNLTKAVKAGEEIAAEATKEVLKSGQESSKGTVEVPKTAEVSVAETTQDVLETSGEASKEVLETRESATEEVPKSGEETSIDATEDVLKTGEINAAKAVDEVLKTGQEIPPTATEEVFKGTSVEAPKEVLEKDCDNLDEGSMGEVDVDPKMQGETDGDTLDEGSKRKMDIDPKTQVAREDIKFILEKFGKINFVDFNRGDLSGYARFDQAESAQVARAHAVLAPGGGFVIKNYVVSLDAVEGEAEKEYWKKVREGQGRKRESGGRGFHDRGRGRGGRFGRGRGGSSRGRGRWGDRNEERVNNGEWRGKHKRFNDDEAPRGKKLARTD